MKKFSVLVIMMLAFMIFVPGIIFSIGAGETQSSGAQSGKSSTGETSTVQNVILMIPDGMSIESYTFARWFSPEWKFTLDEILTGSVRINNSNVPQADSAPAATAMSTGYKSEAPYIGCYPSVAGMAGAKEFDPKKADTPLATVLEAAYRSGRSTGVVSTSNVNHATPAAFASHFPSRKAYDTLIEQMVYQNISVVLGAGSVYLDAKTRKDGQDLIAELKRLGYNYVTDRKGMMSSSSDKLWGMFAPKAMNYDIDRDPNVEPSLAEMTKKAIEVLSKNKTGFFLIVEGSEIDWAGHANDPVGMATDILAYDKAVKVALDFAKKNKNTVVISAADHGTGGITMGNYKTSGTYTKEPLELYTKLIKNAKKTSFGAGLELNKERSNIKEVMARNFGITDLTAEEIKTIKDIEDTQQGIGWVISGRSGIGWTTLGHVGGDIGLYFYCGNPAVRKLQGTIFNHQIGEYIAEVLGVNLNDLTKKLFIEAKPALEKKGAKVEWVETGTDKHELIVKKSGKTYRFPKNKNYVIVDEKQIVFDGLTVFNSKTVFLPQSAINLVK
ncbi:alkaline phosphatase [Treponema phagedenis]|uniref:Alkaline phosphatase family protein n=1 Tax=Treponema phagedenis TaxID=162 RepID=A0A0B7H2A0_TREPH|nr:alkaline phosphatase [Treponema phagedenis]NVP25073.1 alkaline phosphatase [Treponema phagedenis]QEJ94015.1 alkaline phosphatase [Treponema phagedenis]QEK02624.1 alkaline phosphatase [Treponema phagedenis]QEK08250.1 alkaline phosphatase [Treponema phagedenis]QKS91369.1 alkaline phosphatase [Treponema phagedenis]